MPLTKPIRVSPSSSSQKWSGKAARRAWMDAWVAASAAGKHSASTRAMASRSFSVACLISIIKTPLIYFVSSDFFGCRFKRTSAASTKKIPAQPAGVGISENTKMPKIVAIAGSMQASTAATPFSTYRRPVI